MKTTATRTTAKKKNLPVALNIGAGGLGIGGVVLVGGALVTATIVSALAFKNRRQRRRSSSDNMKKNMSPSVDAPRLLYEIKTENIQSLTLDKKHEMDIKDQENTCLERDDGGGNENDEQVDANSLVSDEAVMSAEEYEAIEDGEDHQETVFMNTAAVEDLNQVKVEDSIHDEIVLDNCEGDLSDETGYADQIVHEVVTEEDEASRSINKEGEDEERVQKVEEQVIIEDEAVKVEETDNASRKLVKKDETDEIPQVKYGKEEHDKEENVMVKVELTSGDTSSSMQEEASPESKITIHTIEETTQGEVEMIIDHELVKKDEIPHVETVKKDEDGTVGVDLRSGVSSFSIQEELTQEAKIDNHKTEETIVQVKVEMITDHELVKKDEIPPIESVKEDEDSVEDVEVKAELESSVSSSFMREELTPEAEISNKSEKINAQVKEEMIVDHELVKKDGTLYVEYVKENEDNEKDVTVNADLGSGVSFSSALEEPTPEAKIGNHKIEENMKEDHTILDKNHKDNHDHGVTKEKAFANEPLNSKLMALFVLISVCCLVASLLFILILLASRNRTTNLVKFSVEN
ncbi:uncharacterized protein LOC143553847 isoform X2 [Bidens hawaiensis]|uniref:uncharacterized protein LOC143553847 isoform X2 n=1 Tax=Bidens hawaiensis TaxID=980011 RepID=UPI00404945A4